MSDNSVKGETCADCHWFENINNLPRCCYGPSPLCGSTDPKMVCELWSRRRPPTNYQPIRIAGERKPVVH